MLPPLLAHNGLYDFWYAVPLIVSVSLVYAATRHEDVWAILRRAARVGTMITVFMAAILALLMFISVPL